VSGKSGAQDERPPVWVGHVTLETHRFRDTLRFLRLLGMRHVARLPGLAVLELRGGTHLVLQRTKTPDADPVPFDLMVDDLAATRAMLKDAGLDPSRIKRGMVHRSFEVAEPSGRTLRFYDSHVVGVV